MRSEFTAEAAKGTPAVIGAAYSLANPNTWVMIATGVYVVIQIAYLLRKWYVEEKDRSKKRRP